MNRTETTYKKIKYIRNNLKNNERISKIPDYKIISFLEQKQKKQSIINQIQSILIHLEEIKKTTKIKTKKIININKKILYYKELLILYKNKVKTICDVLKAKCNHIIVNDSIDITPERSQTINYCKKCETTF